MPTPITARFNFSDVTLLDPVLFPDLRGSFEHNGCTCSGITVDVSKTRASGAVLMSNGKIGMGMGSGTTTKEIWNPFIARHRSLKGYEAVIHVMETARFKKQEGDRTLDMRNLSVNCTVGPTQAMWKVVGLSFLLALSACIIQTKAGLDLDYGIFTTAGFFFISLIAVGKIRWHLRLQDREKLNRLLAIAQKSIHEVLAPGGANI